ncbi:MAG: sulfurtransferase [Gammaproteobacteria bacterium]|nr:MAG: sulfurtransferase [Gammaproteobacteria bacterium]
MIKLKALFFTSLFFISFNLQASEPLIDAKWLADNLTNKNIHIIDILPQNIYKKAHIKGSINSSYNIWRVKGLLPSAAYLQKLLQSLGIDETKHIVLVDLGRGAGGVAAVSRIYWTLKVAGLNNVSILNGGLTEWMKYFPKKIEQQENKPSPSSYVVRIQKEYLVDKNDIQKALNSNTIIIDSRSPEEYLSLYPPSPKERSGRLKGAININYSYLAQAGSGLIHNKKNLKKIYNFFGVDTQKKQVSYCHTGHRTALQWFVMHEIFNNKQAYLYDGSMAEWAPDKSLPLENTLGIY